MLKSSGLFFGRYFLYLHMLFPVPILFLITPIISYSAYASSLGYITDGEMIILSLQREVMSVLMSYYRVLITV